VTTSGYDLAIAYRIHPGLAKDPPILRGNKLRLAELCVRSLRASLGALRPKIWVLLDGCPPAYEDLFTRSFPADQLELVRLKGAGNQGTFGMQTELLLEQTASEVVYFAEDDYFYLPGAFAEMVEMLATSEVDFVSPYDHLDYYTLDLHRYRSQVRATRTRHWRTAAATCLTFMTTRETLRRTRHVFASYLRGNSDAALWFALTKEGVWDPRVAWRHLRANPSCFRILAKAWYHAGRQVGWGRRYNLWVPMPSIATHMVEAFLAPSVDWEAAFEERLASLEADDAARVSNETVGLP
jgi:hypothetical protein